MAAATMAKLGMSMLLLIASFEPPAIQPKSTNDF